jgi:hypothetical protein
VVLETIFNMINPVSLPYLGTLYEGRPWVLSINHTVLIREVHLSTSIHELFYPQEAIVQVLSHWAVRAGLRGTSVEPLPIHKQVTLETPLSECNVNNCSTHVRQVRTT